MSRVKEGNKFVNANHYDQSVTNIPKMKRIHSKNEDCHKCTKLAHWLFVKYDISYKTFQNKSKNRKAELRKEFENDTFDARVKANSGNKLYKYIYSSDGNLLKKIECIYEKLKAQHLYRVLDPEDRSNTTISYDDSCERIPLNDGMTQEYRFPWQEDLTSEEIVELKNEPWDEEYAILMDLKGWDGFETNA